MSKFTGEVPKGGRNPDLHYLSQFSEFLSGNCVRGLVKVAMHCRVLTVELISAVANCRRGTESFFISKPSSKK